MLDEWTCRQVTRRRFLAGAGGVALGTLAAAVGCSDAPNSPKPSKRPNVLLIMTDQHRASAMGCAGDAVVRTPNMDRLAAQGVRFGRAYCQGPLCMPARASFLTERYVRDHGVSQNAWDVPTDLPTFLQGMRAAGYHTSCIGKMHLYVHGEGAPRSDGQPGAQGPADTRERIETMRLLGFDEPIETVGKHAAAHIRSEYSDYLERRGLYTTYEEWMTRRRYGRGQVEINGELVDRLPMWHTESVPLPPDAYIDNWVGQRVVEWIDSYDDERPFFQWVGFAGPHDPWDAPREYVDRYRDVEIPLGPLTLPELPDAGPLASFLRAFESFGGSDGLTDEVIREVRRFYYANVTLIDERIGDIMAALDRKGLLDNTWVIYTSDHGEMLGDHRMLTKMVFYEPSIRVPLVIRPPGGMAARTVDSLVEHVDVPATIRGIAGASEVPDSAGQPLLGYLGVGGKNTAKAVAVSEDYGFAAFITERHRLVVHEDTKAPVQLFDLQVDPDENHNVVADPDSAQVLRELMDRHVLPFLSREPARLGPSAF